MKRKVLLYCSLLTTPENGVHNCLPYHYFDGNSFLIDLKHGLFNVQEFLKWVKAEGRGLPYEQEHKSEDYSKYRTKLENWNT